MGSSTAPVTHCSSFWLVTMGWRIWSGLFKMSLLLLSVHLSTTVPHVSSFCPTTEPDFSTVLCPFVWCYVPSRQLHRTTHWIHVQPIGTDVKDYLTLSVSMNCICVQGPVHFVIKIHTKAFVCQHHLDFHPTYGDWLKMGLRLSEIHHYVFGLEHVPAVNIKT